MEWKDYLNDRLIAQHSAGFYVIKQKSMEKSTPLFCDLCNFMMIKHYDAVSYKEWQCCEKCSDKWARNNKDSWNEGWRPSSEEVKAEVKKRKKKVV